jgi:hypothetical protein
VFREGCGFSWPVLWVESSSHSAAGLTKRWLATGCNVRDYGEVFHWEIDSFLGWLAGGPTADIMQIGFARSIRGGKPARGPPISGEKDLKKILRSGLVSG